MSGRIVIEAMALVTLWGLRDRILRRGVSNFADTRCYR